MIHFLCVASEPASSPPAPLPRTSSGGEGSRSRSFLPHCPAKHHTAARAFLLSLLLATPAPAAEESADVRRGKQLFQKNCTACHGADGQGVEDRYPEPLEGDYPLDHLVTVIEQTMPEEDPESCVGQDARDVAAYVFERFYDRSKRAADTVTVELSRLTAEQMRLSVSDLLDGFAGKSKPGEAGGLAAEYYKSRSIKSSDRVVQRTDPVVDFDFGEGKPQPAKKFSSDEEFAIRWSGGVYVEQTGTYEFHLSCENGAKLWVNDLDVPLIDAAVRSGERTERSEPIFLLGGRTYPIRLDFFKNKEDRASISLAWTPPHGVREIVPPRFLQTGTYPRRFVPQTDFPPDDRSEGYERGAAVSRAWAEATVGLAIETANEAADRLDELAGLAEKDSQKDRRRKVRRFAERFVELALRRPIDDEAKARYVDPHFDDVNDLELAVKRLVIVTLQSPRFLYPTLEDDDFAVAARLSYALWDSPPDEELLTAAAEGKLSDVDQVAEHARRMLDDPRSRTKLRGFFRYWLRLDLEADLSKDHEVYPDFDRRLAVDLETSLALFLDEVFRGDSPDFRRLLLDDSLPLNRRAAEFLGAAAEDDSEKSSADHEFVPVAFEGQPRAGVLTHPYLMAMHAHRHAGSPIHRGVFITRGILGRVLRSPPDAIELMDESLHPDLTNRGRVELQTKPANCRTCHDIINPLGFALEHFDGVGRYRDKDGKQDVDASGTFALLNGDKVKFEDARQLAEALAASEETHRSFVARLYEYLTKQPIAAGGEGLHDELTRDFVASGFDMRKLAVRIAAVGAIRP